MRSKWFQGGLGMLVWALPCLLPTTELSSPGGWGGVLPRAHADGSINRLMRWTGWGWSSGYHACREQSEGIHAALPPVGHVAAARSLQPSAVLVDSHHRVNHAASSGYASGFAISPPAAYPAHVPYHAPSHVSWPNENRYLPHDHSILEVSPLVSEPEFPRYRSAVPDSPAVHAERPKRSSDASEPQGVSSKASGSSPSRRGDAEGRGEEGSPADGEAEQLPAPRPTLEDDEDWDLDLDSVRLNRPLRGATTR